MRRGFGMWMLILMILVGVGIGVGAYNLGLSQGLEESGRAVEVVRYHGPGFFPFGLILFPLFLFGGLNLRARTTHIASDSGEYLRPGGLARALEPAQHSHDAGQDESRNDDP